MSNETEKHITDAVQRNLTGAFVSRVVKNSTGYEVDILAMEEGPDAVARIETQVALVAKELRMARLLDGDLHATVGAWH
jgi:hypothetical protein